MKHDVFISYSSHDKHVADAICSNLENNKIRCWIAPRDILGGVEYGEAIVDAIADCQVFLLVFSSKANNSVFVRKEVERGLSKGKILVPFRIEDTLPTNAMEFALSNTHWLDALTPPLEHHISVLTNTILRLLKTNNTPQKHDSDFINKDSSISPEGNQEIASEWLMKTTSGPGQRMNFAMDYDNHKEVIILQGGFGRGKEDNRSIALSSLSPGSMELQDTWTWNGSLWQQLQNNPLTLKNHALAYYRNLNQNMIFGGWNKVQRLNHTYVMQGEEWTKIGNKNDLVPEARESHSLVYDAKRKTIILFGGSTVNYPGGQEAFGDTWEWDGSFWTKIQISSPEPRWGHKMVFNENMGVVVLFGGYNGSKYFNDTWIWEGNTATWSKITTKNMPSARCDYGMTYNNFRKRVFLFGGLTSLGVPANDLWEWDGENWKLVIEHAPPKARYNHGFIYDAKRNKTILYAGYDGKEFFQDTWEFFY